MATKKNLSESEVTSIENKLMPILTNEPSGWIKVTDEVEVKFKRPKFIDKYKFQSWTSQKLAEIEVDSQDRANEQVVFYITYFGAVNGNVISMKVNGEDYTLDLEKDYKFLFEQYVMEEVYSRTNNEEEFVFAAITKLLEWQSSTEVPAEDLKNS